MKIKPLSIKVKITLWFTALIIFMCAAMFVLLFVISTSVLHRDVKEDLVNLVTANAQEIEYCTYDEYSEREYGDQFVIYNDGYLEIDDDFLDSYDGVFTALYDSQGELLYGQVVKGAPIIYTSDIKSFKSNSEKYYVYCVALEGDGLDGLILEGAANENANKTVLTRVSNMYLVVLPFLALSAIVGGYLLAKRFLKPIDEISASAEKISNGEDLSQRIQLKEGGDELHRLADTFNGMFERLEKSFEDEKQFTSDISHELRTPVTTALAQSELVLEENPAPEEYRQALQVIKKQCLRMKSILDDMMSFSRLEKTEKLSQTEIIDFSELVGCICEEQSMRKDKNISIESKAEKGIFVSGSYNLLISLVENLISNAFRYGRENGYIKVSLEKNEFELILRVADNGTGVAPEIQDKIFNRFFRGDSSRNSDESRYGLGLGLPMARRIAVLHGGTLELESSSENGSTFCVKLPIANKQQ